MEHNIFTVHDVVANRFLDPFVAPTIEFAIREFRHSVNTDGHQLNRYPSDFVLYHIGTFDPENGRVNSSDPRSLGVAISFLNHPDQEQES